MGEDHLRLIEHRRPTTAILSVVQGLTSFEREQINELIISQHSDEIESLKEKIEEKNEEISRLHKAMKELEDKNKRLDIALKTRIEEITKLKSRISKLETEKKGLEDKLRNVEGKLDRVEREVEELDKAKLAQEEENVSLREHLEIVSGEMESVKKDLEKTRETVVHTNRQLQGEDHSSRCRKAPQNGGRQANGKTEMGRTSEKAKLERHVRGSDEITTREQECRCSSTNNG